ncbi:MAG: hypothetical protein U5R31_05205 [Acidimicrobiia bacterium]|nr:hypothetical protein [Acidimicrobiia bacterium]
MRTLVHDAAARAHRVRVIDATSVVVTEDPADLATAVKLKSAKLTSVSDTVAVSTLAAEKLRQVLDRKGLAPTVVSTSGGELTPRRSSDEAARLERAAQNQREFARHRGYDRLAEHADELRAGREGRADTRRRGSPSRRPSRSSRPQLVRVAPGGERPDEPPHRAERP